VDATRAPEVLLYTRMITFRLAVLPDTTRSWNKQPPARIVGSATYDAFASAQQRAVTPEKIDLPASASRVARFLRRRVHMAMRQEVRR